MIPLPTSSTARLLALAAILLVIPRAAADDAPRAGVSEADVADVADGADRKELLTVTFENDFFLGTGKDDSYTNGWRIMWTTESLDLYEEDYLPRETAETFSFLPFLGSDGFDDRFTVAVGQVMATPEDITLDNPPPNSQPYFGLLFLSAGLIAHSDDAMHTYEALLGVTGSASLAEQTQTIFHHIIGADEPRGWDHQVHTEPVLNVSYRFRYRLLDIDLGRGWSCDTIPHVGGDCGNLMIKADAGAVFRLGYNLPRTFGPNLIMAGLESQAFTVSELAPEGTFELFAGVNSSLVAHSMPFDGNTMRDYNRSVEKKSAVTTYLAGVGYRDRDFGITLNWLVMSDSFKGQKEDSDFVSVGILYNF